MAIYVKVKSLTYIILSLHKLMAGQNFSNVLHIVAEFKDVITDSY
uniref:Uncharacterized protein n=1 Tax=Anguilla anguilla TaxID=7936 RepID=A0A0E9UGD9_ANGAN